MSIIIINVIMILRRKSMVKQRSLQRILVNYYIVCRMISGREEFSMVHLRTYLKCSSSSGVITVRYLSHIHMNGLVYCFVCYHLLNL